MSNVQKSHIKIKKAAHLGAKRKKIASCAQVTPFSSSSISLQLTNCVVCQLSPAKVGCPETDCTCHWKAARRRARREVRRVPSAHPSQKSLAAFAAHLPGHWICCTPRVMCRTSSATCKGCSRRDQGSRPVGGAHGEGRYRFCVPHVSRVRAPPSHRLLRKLLLPSHDAHRRRHKTKIVLYLLV